MPLYLSRKTLVQNDQAAAEASTSTMLEDIKRQYQTALNPEPEPAPQEPAQPQWSLPSLESLGVSGAPSSVMQAIGGLPQRARETAQSMAPQWSLPSLESLGVSAPKQPATPNAQASSAEGASSLSSVGAPEPVAGGGWSSPPAAPTSSAPSGYAPSSGAGSPNVERWSPIIAEAARAENVPEWAIKGLMEIESGGDPEAVSSAGAQSLMQVMPFHFKPGENPKDPRTNIMRGAKVYGDALRRYGDPDKAAAAYFGAIDANGNPTSATDGSSVDGHAYVRLFREAASKYGGSIPNAGATPSAPAAPPAPPSAAPPAADGGSGQITVKHKRSGLETTMSAGGWRDVTDKDQYTVVSGQQPDMLRMSLSEPQPFPEDASDGDRNFTGTMPDREGARPEFNRNIVPFDPTTNQTGEPDSTPAWYMGDMQRQPLSPTMGPDTATGEQYDPDQGPRELGYSVPAEPATYGDAGDEPQVPQSGLTDPNLGSVNSQTDYGPPLSEAGPEQPEGVDWGAGARNLGAAVWDRVIAPAMQAVDAANEMAINSPIGNLNPQAWGRELAGWEQLGNETKEDQDRLNALVARFKAGDAAAEPEIQALTASLNARLGKGRQMREVLLEAGQRNPDKTAEGVGQFVQGAAATALAPGLGSGVVRNIGAAVLDPVGQGIGAALEVPGRAVEAARGLGTRVSEGLAQNAERVAGADARMAAEGSTVAPAALGQVPEQFGRPYPDIKGRVGDYQQNVLGEPSAEMIRDSRLPRDAVHPDLRAAGIGPEITPQVDLSSRQNSALGIVPEGAAPRTMTPDEARQLYWQASNQHADFVAEMRAKYGGGDWTQRMTPAEGARLEAIFKDMDAANAAFEGPRPPDRLGAVNRALGQGVASSVSGGVGAAVNQEMNPDDPYAGVKGFAVGAGGPLLAARGARAVAKRVGATEGAGQGLLAMFGQAPGAGGFNPNAVQRAVQRAQRQAQPGLSPLQWARKLAGEAGYSSMIGPATFTVNLMGNVMEPLYSIPKEAARGVARAVSTGNVSALREPGEMAQGVLHGGVVNGLREVGSAMVDALTASGKYAPTPGHAPLSAQTQNPIGKAIATGLEAGGRVFSALPDAIFGTIAQGAGEARAAAQIATDSGLKGTAWKQHVNDLLTDAANVRAGQLPSLSGTQQVIDEGAAYAKRQTFQDDLGTIGKKARTFATVGDMPVIGNLVTPFFNTPWNMNTRLAERSPLGFVMNSQGSKFDKMYDATLGSALLIGLAAGPVASGVITGGGPDDPQKKSEMRSQGWRPYSTLIDGVYVPNRVFGIYAPLLNAAADVHDSIAYSKDKSPASIASNYAGRLGQQLQQQPYLQGISSIMQTIQAGQGGGLGSAAERYASSTITRMVPYAATARTIGTALDPNERTVDQGKNVPAGTTISQQVQSGIGARGGLPIAQNVLGQPQENQQQGLKSVFARTSSEKPDATVKAFLDAGVDIGFPKTKLTVDTIPIDLTPDETRRWNTYRGEVLSRFGSNMTSRSFWANPEARQVAMQDLLRQANDVADQRLMQSIGAADIRRRVLESRTQQREALRTGAP